jgi:hypothetical protein
MTIRYTPHPWRLYPCLEPWNGVALPDGWSEKSKWICGSLRCAQHPPALFGRAGRHAARAARRLIRIPARSAEQPVSLDGLFNCPWLGAGEMGDWELTAAQARNRREYPLRGGFLFPDGCWDTEEWNRCNESVHEVFPHRSTAGIEDAGPIVHTVYNLDARVQIPEQWAIRRGATYRADGRRPHWRGIYGGHGHSVAATPGNSVRGGAGEWADGPNYPARYATSGIRTGVNYIVYSMTH